MGANLAQSGRKLLEIPMTRMIETYGLETVQKVHHLTGSGVTLRFDCLLDSLMFFPNRLKLIEHSEVIFFLAGEKGGVERYVPNTAKPPRVESCDFDLISDGGEAIVFLQTRGQFLFGGDCKRNYQEARVLGFGFVRQRKAPE